MGFFRKTKSDDLHLFNPLKDDYKQHGIQIPMVLGGLGNSNCIFSALCHRCFTPHLRGKNDEKQSFLFRKLPYFQDLKLQSIWSQRSQNFVQRIFNSKSTTHPREFGYHSRYVFFFFNLPECTFMHIGPANAVHSHGNAVEKVTSMRGTM